MVTLIDLARTAAERTPDLLHEAGHIAVTPAAQRSALAGALADAGRSRLLKAPGEWGADIVVSNSQRFDVPFGFGLPDRDPERRYQPGAGDDPFGLGALFGGGAAGAGIASAAISIVFFSPPPPTRRTSMRDDSRTMARGNRSPRPGP